MVKSFPCSEFGSVSQSTLSESCRSQHLVLRQWCATLVSASSGPLVAATWNDFRMVYRFGKRIHSLLYWQCWQARSSSNGISTTSFVLFSSSITLHHLLLSTAPPFAPSTSLQSRRCAAMEGYQQAGKLGKIVGPVTVPFNARNLRLTVGL